jgi:hypothetical protein
MLAGYILIVTPLDPFFGCHPEPVDSPARLLDPDLPETIPVHPAGNAGSPRQPRSADPGRVPATTPKPNFSGKTA